MVKHFLTIGDKLRGKYALPERGDTLALGLKYSVCGGIEEIPPPQGIHADVPSFDVSCYYGGIFICSLEQVPEGPFCFGKINAVATLAEGSSEHRRIFDG